MFGVGHGGPCRIRFSCCLVEVFLLMAFRPNCHPTCRPTHWRYVPASERQGQYPQLVCPVPCPQLPPMTHAQRTWRSRQLRWKVTTSTLHHPPDLPPAFRITHSIMITAGQKTYHKSTGNVENVGDCNCGQKRRRQQAQLSRPEELESYDGMPGTKDVGLGHFGVVLVHLAGTNLASKMQSRHPVVEGVKLRVEVAAPAPYIPASFQCRLSVLRRSACFQTSPSSQLLGADSRGMCVSIPTPNQHHHLTTT